ncbi:hypothetical protein DFH06DRAFT_991314, partial [Mycena polygramma]
LRQFLGNRVKSRSRGRKMMYICWEGYGSAEDSWVSETDIRNAPALKREYIHSVNQ